MLAYFHNSFTVTVSMEFAIKRSLKTFENVQCTPEMYPAALPISEYALNVSRLDVSPPAGTQFTYPGEVEG